jgi:hypothetical protein
MVVQKVGKEAFGRKAIFCVWIDKAKKAEAAFDAEVLKILGDTVSGAGHR